MYQEKKVVLGNNGVTEKGKLTWYKIGIYYIIFFTLLCIKNLIIRPVFLDTLNILAFQIVESIIKLLIYTLPAILLIKYYQNDMWIGLKEMFTNKPNWLSKIKPEKKPKWYEFNIEQYPLIIYLLLLLLLPLRALLVFRGLSIHPTFQPIRLIEGVLFVGITEEIAFRGWLLNAFIKKMKLWPAILLNSMLFLFFHFPFWVYIGHDIFTILFGSLGIFAISIIFCIIFIKSKNILVPIIFHMAWNLLYFTFNGMEMIIK